MTREFEYGPLAKGLYIALFCVSVPLLLLYPQYIVRYLVFLVVLGFGLRPFLVWSGLFGLWRRTLGAAERKWDEKHLADRRTQIERKQASEKYRRSRHRDPRLPKNW
ncbi:MAG: hypothetical protein HKN19_01010 [Halioglobus sp.]|nr:hypothetical protein [Halioglobus sp.]